MSVKTLDADVAEEVERITPTIDTDNLAERFVDYSVRKPGDFVLSGPIGSGWGPGKWFKSRQLAYIAARAKYGDRVQLMERQSWGRWSFLIKEAK